MVHGGTGCDAGPQPCEYNRGVKPLRLRSDPSLFNSHNRFCQGININDTPVAVKLDDGIQTWISQRVESSTISFSINAMRDKSRHNDDQWVAIDWLVERYITTHLVSRCPTIVYYWRSVGYLWKPSHHVSYLSGVKLTFLISPAEPLIHITSSSFGLVCLGRWTPLDPVCASSGGKSGTA